jgi:hypothetical protein
LHQKIVRVFFAMGNRGIADILSLQIDNETMGGAGVSGAMQASNVATGPTKFSASSDLLGE